MEAGQGIAAEPSEAPAGREGHPGGEHHDEEDQQHGVILPNQEPETGQADLAACRTNRKKSPRAYQHRRHPGAKPPAISVVNPGSCPFTPRRRVVNGPFER
ncbi:hypothetical protein GCM10009804_47830 [Kribbella hippodromi]|uniref:Uncharacterized protein n=1 Tax=Kribbella hippodromi TaxID=434347 RepID=A0ABP4PMT8_9ACTN